MPDDKKADVAEIMADHAYLEKRFEADHRKFNELQVAFIARGERLGEIEKVNAVQNERISNMNNDIADIKKNTESIKNSHLSLQVKVATIVGIIGLLQVIVIKTLIGG